MLAPYHEMYTALRTRMAHHLPHPLADADWQQVAALWQPWQADRSQVLTGYGEVEQYFYYIHTGYTYMWFPHEGEEQVVGFAYNGDYGGVYDSYIAQLPSRFVYVALTECHGLRIRHTDLQQAYATLPALEHWGRRFLEDLFVLRVNREMELATLSTEARLQRMWQRSRHLFVHIPQKLLASYLGMKPETLSRLRKHLE